MKYHVLTQYVEGTLKNGKKFCFEITPEAVDEICKIMAERLVGEKVKTAHIVFKRRKE
jgi:hypothetical protein